MSAPSFDSITSLPPRDRLPAYLALLPDLYQSPLPGLPDLVIHLVSDPAVSLVVARQVYAEIVAALGDNRITDEDAKRVALEKILEKISDMSGGAQANFEEQTTVLRLQLADLLEAEEDWLEAAKVLTTVPLESPGIKWSAEQKVQHLVHIVRLLIEVGDDGQAQTFFNRASLLIHDCKDQATRLAYKLSNARLLDFGRKFQEAGLRYHEVSWVTDLDEEDRLQALSAAVTCSILAPAGPARQRLLSSLYRDERTPSLPTYTILAKMFLENIIRPAEVIEFEKGLLPHQLARLPPVKREALGEDEDEAMEEDGASRRLGPETVLDRAVMEHNLLSCSKLYVNISFSGLGTLLDLAPTGAETMARKMIEQERLRGWIDQIDQLIYFEGRDTTAEGEGQTTAGGLGTVEKKPLDFQGVTLTERWDANIGRTAQKVEAIANLIKQRGLLAPIPAQQARPASSMSMVVS